MKTLSGILDFSMGNFLCLRGFADYKTLSRISEENKDVQRELIEKHKGEMAAFLNSGEYRFFPEIVLSVSLLTGNNHSEVSNFLNAVIGRREWNKKLGDINISIFNHDAGDKNRVAHIAFDETKIKLNRIDGNHRLSAANEVIGDFKVPFCLILCQNPDDENRYSRAIFHNINAKQIPLDLEENLKVILDSDSVFTDDKLKSDPSFGWKYYLARKAPRKIDFSKFPFIQTLIRDSEYTYFLEEFDLLLHCGLLNESDASIETFTDELPAIEESLQEAQLNSLPQNLAVIGAISYYKLTDPQKHKLFLRWVKENCIAEAPNIHMADLIEIFDKVYENMPKSVFMSMQFCRETEDTYQTVKDVRETLKRENNIDFELIKVDEHTDGYSDEIYHRIIDGIKKSSLVIADLSYGNKNVHHEIGYAQGLNKKVLLLYQTRNGVDSKMEIGSNISMHDQLRFVNQTELRPALLKKIRQFFGISSDEN